MNISRRNFLQGLGAAASAYALAGCRCPLCCSTKGKIALQLYSIRNYIGGIKNKETGKVTLPARGLPGALEDVAKIGYTGVEFAGNYGYKPAELKAMLAQNGLIAVGAHVDNSEYGFSGLKDGTPKYDPEVLKRTLAFTQGYGNNYICCPGGGNIPKGFTWKGKGTPTAETDEFIKRLCDFYNKAAADAAKMGGMIGLHNHIWEFNVKMLDGTSYWDYFFANTDPAVQMEQDVGWTTCAGFDPCDQWRKYPNRSFTLHAKENGMGEGVKKFDAILGKPGEPGAKGVEWQNVLAAAEKDGIAWWVVECEEHCDSLAAVDPSYKFLKELGLN